jgi:FkbM family methyltransferase
MEFAKKLLRRAASLIPERDVIKTLPDFKMRLNTAHYIDFKILYSSFEPNTIAVFKRLVKPGMTVIDVGANIGWMTLHLASLVGETGRVFAFEPSEWTYERLNHNLRLSNFPWVMAVHAAVGPSDISNIELMLPCGYRLDGKDTATKQHVPVVALDTVVGEDVRVDFIKSDTDGFEPGVFEGAAGILQKYKPIVFFEVAPDHTRRAGHNLEQTFANFTKLGYRFENETEQTIDPIVEMAKIPFNKSINVLARADAG